MKVILYNTSLNPKPETPNELLFSSLSFLGPPNLGAVVSARGPRRTRFVQSGSVARSLGPLLTSTLTPSLARSFYLAVRRLHVLDHSNTYEHHSMNEIGTCSTYVRQYINYVTQ